ncbi:hypothetical protein L1887_28974 [Cichorium endivia]|nr:hypothetical protein L1887_28974 [Cichorium endivia]
MIHHMNLDYTIFPIMSTADFTSLVHERNSIDAIVVDFLISDGCRWCRICEGCRRWFVAGYLKQCGTYLDLLQSDDTEG